MLHAWLVTLDDNGRRCRMLAPRNKGMSKACTLIDAVTRCRKGKTMQYRVILTARKGTLDRFGYEQREKLAYIVDGMPTEGKAVDMVANYLPTIGRSIIDYRVTVDNETLYGI